jgi:hypothetical protein
MPDRRYAYLHGFASGPRSHKGNALARAFAARGLTFHLPDLNRPSFAEITFSGMLAAFDELDAATAGGGAWCLVGSSMGGYTAARWSELHPEAVDRLVLLAPGFELPERWRQALGEEQVAEWRRRGWVEVPDLDGTPTRIGWRLMEDALAQPPYPEVACPTLVLHGRRDDVVPPETTERFAAGRANVTVEWLDDDHALVDSLPLIERRVLDWFGVG